MVAPGYIESALHLHVCTGGRWRYLCCSNITTVPNWLFNQKIHLKLILANQRVNDKTN